MRTISFSALAITVLLAFSCQNASEQSTTVTTDSTTQITRSDANSSTTTPEVIPSTWEINGKAYTAQEIYKIYEESTNPSDVDLVLKIMDLMDNPDFYQWYSTETIFERYDGFFPTYRTYQQFA